MAKQNYPEYQYLDLAKEILKTGIKQVDRGTGVADYSLSAGKVPTTCQKDFRF